MKPFPLSSPPVVSSLHPPWSDIPPWSRCVPSGAARGLRGRDIPARRPGLRTDSCSRASDSDGDPQGDAEGELAGEHSALQYNRLFTSN